MTRLHQNHQEKAASAFFLSSQKLKIESLLFSLLILFLPTQLGKHFWPDFSIVNGIRVDYLSPTLYFTDVLIVLLFIVWTYKNHQRLMPFVKNKSRKFGLVSFVIFAGYLSFQSLFSQSPLNNLYHLLKVFEFSFVAWYVSVTIRTSQQLLSLCFFLSISIIGESFLAIAQFIKQGAIGGILYFFGERLFTSQTPGIANASIDGALLLRPYGTFSHPNVLAGFLLCAMLLLLFLFPFFKRIRMATLHIIALLLGTSALLLTMSRMAIVLWGLLLISVVFYELHHRVLQKKKQILLFVGFCILVLSINFFTPAGTRLLHTSLSEEAVSQRTALIASSIELLKHSPLFGVGLGNFLPALATVKQSLALGLYLQPVHNIFLLVLVETGLVGFFFFGWFIIKIYKRLLSLVKLQKQNAKIYQVFLILLTAVLCLGLFDHYFLTLQQGQLLFALVLGLCWTTITREKEESREFVLRT